MAPTLCLNMIVKNESKIIARLLETVLPIIDSYCICDTGSTDNTKEIIETFFAERGVKGEVFEVPFKNFGYNRTVALQRAAAWADYALLLDADMKLVIGPDFRKENLVDDGYMIIQGNSRLEYYNTRIIKTSIGARCVSPTHEYYDFPDKSRQPRWGKNVMHINDIGDGGCKADKFERDIRLLKEGLEEDPKNPRYHFYIANSYRDLGKKEEAIAWYKKRVEIGGWVEEVWNSLLEMGKCYLAINDAPNGLYYLWEAYNFRPQRAESLYEIAKYYREKGKQQAGQLVCDRARQIPFPKDDVLFIQKDVYDYLLEYEHSILMYYTKVPVDHRRYLDLIGTGHNRENVVSNYQFYYRNLKDICKVVKRISFNDAVEKTVRGKLDSFKSSSPCIMPFSEGYLMNVRYVNYNLDKQRGSYSYRHDDQKIITLNKAVLMNRDLEVMREHWFDKVHREDIRYLGVEDVKVFSHEGELRFLGTVQDEQGRPRVGGGVYDLNGNDKKSDVLVPTVYPSPVNADCEKNWVHLHHKGKLKTVYNWKPLLIGNVDEGKFSTDVCVEEVPAFFRDLRGSTNGCLVGDEVWFLGHVVGYSTPRHYYHVFVVLDADTLKVKRHSTLFKFEGEKIEYALGLVVEPDRILISYSKWDAESVLSVYDRKSLEEAVF
jgi:glycosyltransferase involved in cell wall biosynthesis